VTRAYPGTLINTVEMSETDERKPPDARRLGSVH